MLKKLKYLFIFFLVAIFLFSIAGFTSAEEQEKLRVYFFYGDGCPHCAKEEIFLDSLEKEYKDELEILRYEVWHNQENSNKLAQMAEEIGFNVSGIPLTIIGTTTIAGYNSDFNTGRQIKLAIDEKLGREIVDLGAIPEKLDVPVFGEVNTKNLSLPAFTIIIGFVDGFNPCAMWVLIFLIGILISLNDRKRMAIIGSAFIISSALFYYLILNTWLNLLLFLNYISWIKLAIGAAGIIGGIFQLKEYNDNKEGVCKVTKNQGRKKIFDRIRELTRKESLWLALGGVILLAVSVNLVELVCSLGLPVVFTQVLALANLSSLEKLIYIFLYILFFMADDIIVFILALLTAKTKYFSTKYSRYSNLVGGIIMLIIGLLLIFKPNWLMFG